MMTRFQEFWARIVRATPGFGEAADTKVTLSVGAVKKLAAKAHRDGFRHGIQTAGTLEGIGKTTDPTEDFMNILRRGQK